VASARPAARSSARLRAHGLHHDEAGLYDRDAALVVAVMLNVRLTGQPVEVVLAMVSTKPLRKTHGNTPMWIRGNGRGVVFGAQESGARFRRRPSRSAHP